jgi:hypothetical protein
MHLSQTHSTSIRSEPHSAHFPSQHLGESVDRADPVLVLLNAGQVQVVCVDVEDKVSTFPSLLLHRSGGIPEVG